MVASPQRVCLLSVHALDLSLGTELLPPYKVIVLTLTCTRSSLVLLTIHFLPQVLVLSLSDLTSVTHLVVAASNLNGKQVTGP